jgi:hypothetical protein
MGNDHFGGCCDSPGALLIERSWTVQAFLYNGPISIIRKALSCPVTSKLSSSCYQGILALKKPELIGSIRHCKRRSEHLHD